MTVWCKDQAREWGEDFPVYPVPRKVKERQVATKDGSPQEV